MCSGAADLYIELYWIVYHLLDGGDGITEHPSSCMVLSPLGRAATKLCHPDFLGEEGHNICVLLNEAYEVLSDEHARAEYNLKLEEGLKDEEDDFTGKPLSKWMPSIRPKSATTQDPYERRAVFVGERIVAVEKPVSLCSTCCLDGC